MNRILSCLLLLLLPLSMWASRPNILIILTDDQGYGDVGFNGNPIVRTPRLDALAKDSLIFERFYAAPVCSPTRASLLTGRFALRTGVVDTQSGLSILPPEEQTLAEALQKLGYRTGMSGKWHLGDNAPARPIDQGFDYSLTHTGGMIGMPYSPPGHDSYFDPLLMENGRETQRRGYVVDIFTDAAIDFIRAEADQPFFLYYAPNTPHHPLTVPEHYAQPYLKAGYSPDTARYYGMITNMDDNVGRLVDALKENGQWDNTIVIFLGDNGTSSLHKQEDLWEVGLRGRKTYVYENGIRVPMFIRVPKLTSQGQRISTAASVEDVMPTLLALLGAKAENNLDGVSFVPLLQNRAAEFHKPFIIQQFHRMMSPPQRYRNIAVIMGKDKLVQPIGRGNEAFSADAMRFELYDLEADPGETKDLAALYPDKVEALRAVYDRWLDETSPQSFAGVPTLIGKETVVLSRQDWMGGGLSDGDLGHYQIDVQTAGTYRITCQWGQLLKEAHPVTLQVGDRILQKDILYAESQCRFDAVWLSQGPTRLKAFVEIDGKQMGMRFIRVEKVDEEELFAQENGGSWKELFFDDCTGDWKRQWFLDGEVGKVETGPNGMRLTSGPEALNDAHHMVLWTRESFHGDLKIDYEYTRLDEQTNFVNILYVQATGSGEAPYLSDITQWNELRRVPAMRMYFNHMHTYHISYAAFPNDEDTTSYIRARRYMPNRTGLKGTELEPDYFPQDLFGLGVPHQITVIKKDRNLFMRVANKEQTFYAHMHNPDLPIVSSGRVGLRQMFTRSARYQNFRISVPEGSTPK